MDMQDIDTICPQRRIATIAFGWALIVWGVFWCVAAWSLPARRAFEPIAIGLLPLFGGALLALAGANIVRVYSKMVPVPSVDEEPLFDWGGQARVVAIIVIILAYTLLLERVHYMITTFFAAGAVLYVAGERLSWGLLLKALVMSTLLFVIFIRWFDIMLPGSRFF